ncbi:hypothetical protein Sjap_024835 [Stephania japonica]|uniref:Uncharacterized protein n=1 Tax=Stephania japonica TaxID=461633 RepID=A0AAP0ELC0_9MAGN
MELSLIRELANYNATLQLFLKLKKLRDKDRRIKWLCRFLSKVAIERSYIKALENRQVIGGED